MLFDKLKEFCSAYIECAIWASSDDEGEALDRKYEVSDIDPQSKRHMISDCASFLIDAAPLVERAIEEHGYSWERAGHDFWLIRNGHGAGYWDRGLGKLADKLTELAKSCRECYLYVGHDGLVYVT